MASAQRICVIGGGTAGHMAVAHLSRFHPDCEIVHLFDSRNATIGVGEGTTPGAVAWLQDVGIAFPALQESCAATRKDGLSLEGWGRMNESFPHYFMPRGRNAIHFSAAKLPQELARKSCFEYIDSNLKTLESSEDGVVITTSCDRRIDCNLVVDARGFPPQDPLAVLTFPWIPTNAALVTRVPDLCQLTVTRSVAMPNGWIFVIPLLTSTAFGYIFDSRLTSQGQIELELTKFLADNRTDREGRGGNDGFRRLNFPNFTRRWIFDGRVFSVGNAASFLEPLEATAIGVTVYQLGLLSHWLERKTRQGARWQVRDKMVRDDINTAHLQTMQRISLFVAWHYVAGSAFETVFWGNAKRGFLSSLGLPWMSSAVQEFGHVLERSESILADDGRVSEIEPSTPKIDDGVVGANFGGFNEMNFSQVARGLGWGHASLLDALSASAL